MNGIGYTFFIIGIMFLIVIFCFNIYRAIENKKTMYMIINCIISIIFIIVGVFFIIH